MPTRHSRKAGRRFTFVALGDAPYGPSDGTTPWPETLAQFERLIDRVNAIAPAFSVHLGDIKDGSTTSRDGEDKDRIPCTEAYFRTIRGRFDRFRDPFVYTPGDNESTDCTCGTGLTPPEAIAALRRVFFTDVAIRPQNRSLAIESQGQRGKPKHRAYIENLRWWREGVLFATANVVGNNDNAPDGDKGDAQEHKPRSAAARAWIADAFTEAKTGNAHGLVLMMQADPWRPPKRKGSRSGFTKLLAELNDHLKTFRRPVLLVHGDGHCYCNGLPEDLKLPKAMRRWLQRVQVFGETATHAVRIRVNPQGDAETMFTVTPLRVPGNPHWDPKCRCPQYKGKYKKGCTYG